MKIFNAKTVIAAVCVVAAGFGGMKAYSNANQSQTDMLLAENIEALSCSEAQDQYDQTRQCPYSSSDDCTYTKCDGTPDTKSSATNQYDHSNEYKDEHAEADAANDARNDY